MKVSITDFNLSLHLCNELKPLLKIKYMEPKIFCQSCGMPIDHISLRGTEADGSMSAEYCAYCYLHGHFVNPQMKLDEMKSLVKKIMEEKKISPTIVEEAVDGLPNLKRWRAQLQSSSIIM